MSAFDAYLFEVKPRFPHGSAELRELQSSREAWEAPAGPAAASSNNHDLGGLLIIAEIPTLGQPRMVIVWGGVPGLAWFVSYEAGVAEMFATQIMPPEDAFTLQVVSE